MFHLLAFNVGAATFAVNTQLTGAADQVFTRQNGTTYNLSEQYDWLAAYIGGTSVTDCNLDMPSINALAKEHLLGINRSATIPSNPVVDDRRHAPHPIPMFENLAVFGLNDGAASPALNAALLIAPRGNTLNLPAGQRRLTIRATASVVTTANVWSAPVALTFAENLRNGWWAVVGGRCVAANTLFWRLIFARAPLFAGRALRPGGLAQNANGDVPWWPQLSGGLGEWGRFAFNEGPQIEVFATASATVTHTMFLDVVYLGDQGQFASPAGGGVGA